MNEGGRRRRGSLAAQSFITKAGRQAARRAFELSFFVFFFFSSLMSDDDERQVWGRSREMPFLAGWLGWAGRIVGLVDRGRRLLHIPPHCRCTGVFPSASSPSSPFHFFLIGPRSSKKF